MTASLAMTENQSALSLLPQSLAFGLDEQRVVIREMLRTMEEVTLAGRIHLMEKVVEQLRRHVERATPRLGPRNSQAVANLYENLGRQARDVRPDVRMFSNGVLGLMALLSGFSR